MNYSIVDKEKKDQKNEPKTSYISEVPSWNLKEIVLPEDILETLEEFVIFYTHKEQLLIKWEFNRFLKGGGGLAINFFGPPGTGKSITAEGLANRLEMNILKVDYSELESKYVGDTSKNLKDVFDNAEKTNSLLFFDEADAVLSKRISNISQSSDHSVNLTRSTLLTLLDKFKSVVVFASNFMESYDQAFLRRIPFHVNFPLPNFELRKSIWKLHISSNIPRDINYEKLAEISEGLSGGDIRNIAIKLGLKLVAKKISKIDEYIANAEIAKYLQTMNFATKNSKDVRVFEEEVKDIKIISN